MIKKHTARDGSVSFQVYSRVTGAKKYVGTFTSDKAAAEALQDHEAQQRAIARGELPPEVDDKRTLAAACEAWFTSLEKRKSRSARIHRGRYRLYFAKALGSVPVDRIRTHHVMTVRDALVSKVSPATINSAVMTMSAAFRYFMTQQWVTANPCRGIEPVEVMARTYRWIKTSAEISRLIEATQPEARDLVVLALGTGLRFDELLCLQWDDVDMGQRLITVHRGRKGPAKGNKVRHVPILDAVLPTLRAMALRRKGMGRLFPGQGGGIRDQQPIRTMFKRALVKAGLDPQIRVHDCRHSFASHWVMNGGDLWRLSKVLGHGSVTVTEKFYAHLRPEVFVQDYQRITFATPDTEDAVILPFSPDARRPA